MLAVYCFKSIPPHFMLIVLGYILEGLQIRGLDGFCSPAVPQWAQWISSAGKQMKIISEMLSGKTQHFTTIILLSLL